MANFSSFMQKEMASVKSAQLALRAVNHPLRLKIIELIKSKGEMPVTDIYFTLRLEQSVASQHLAILRGCKIVKTRRDGKQINYSVNEKRIMEIVKLCEIIKTIAAE